MIWTRPVQIAARALGALLLALALACGGAPPVRAQPPIWIVRSKSATVVLFGSVHLLPAGLDWRPPALEDALGRARELWFELPLTVQSDNEAEKARQKRGWLPTGVSLSALMTPEKAAKLRKVATDLNCVMSSIDAMRPWLAEVTVSVAADARSGGDAFNGVEDQVQAIAPPGVPRRAFETADQQIDFLAGAPQADQIASLNLALQEIEDDPASYARLVDEWMSADIAGIERDAIEPLKSVSPVYYERLLVSRNRKWSKIVRSMLRQPGLTVMVVGIGHLIGPDGLPAMLRADGLQVEGP
jgi:uncharacterized protein YbaP (TraB family)